MDGIASRQAALTRLMLEIPHKRSGIEKVDGSNTKMIHLPV